MTEQTEPRLTWRGRLVALLFGVVLLAVLSEVVVRIAMPNWRDFHSGWFMARSEYIPGHGFVTTGRPGFNGFFAQNNGDFRVSISINRFGLRNREPVEDSDQRVWFVGDSMTFGWGVEYDAMFSVLAGRSAGFPTYNVASPGAGVCGYQALVARMPRELRPTAVVVGLVLENDIADFDCAAEARRVAKDSVARSKTTDVYSDLAFPTSLGELKVFLARHLAIYNFFAVSVKRVDPLHTFLTFVGLVKPVHQQSFHGLTGSSVAAAKSTAAEVARLRSMLRAGTPFVVLIVPSRFEIRDDEPVSAARRKVVREALAAHGIEFIDVFEPIRDIGLENAHFTHDGHWSPAGHRAAADAIADWLTRVKPH